MPPTFSPPLPSFTHLDSLGPRGRRAAYERGELSRPELFAWARRFPDEPPLINGELAWIARGLADLD